VDEAIQRLEGAKASQKFLKEKESERFHGSHLSNRANPVLHKKDRRVFSKFHKV
jgi:hypothetical protein